MSQLQRRVGIVGYGTIGSWLAQALDRGVQGLTLAGVTTRTKEKAVQGMAGFTRPAPVLSIEELVERSDVVVDCVPKAAFLEIARPALKKGRLLVTVSGAALLANPDIVEFARKNGGRIILATGAILALDAIRAAAEGVIHSVRMVTRKPPAALAGSPHLVENKISVEGLSEPKKVFEGTAADGARGFPSNVNVAAAVGMAGIGAESTALEIWADPTISRNMHEIVVDSDSARLTMKIENIPTDSNPATGRITAQSVLAVLRSHAATLRVGS